MEHNELKPCPFCGYEGILLYRCDPYDGYHGDFAMWHAKCGICAATIRRTEKSEVIKDWNRRAKRWNLMRNR